MDYKKVLWTVGILLGLGLILDIFIVRKSPSFFVLPVSKLFPVIFCLAYLFMHKDVFQKVMKFEEKITKPVLNVDVKNTQPIRDFMIKSVWPVILIGMSVLELLASILIFLTFVVIL